MAKRFTSTEIWSEDWFLAMPSPYKLFWFYLLSACNHAGLFKVNLRSFCALVEVNVTPEEALRHFNNGKDRIRIVKDGMWLIEDFFSFQYGSTFNPNNRVHESVEKEYNKVDVDLSSIRGLKDLKDKAKEKDKDKDKEQDNEDLDVDAEPTLDNSSNGFSGGSNETQTAPRTKEPKTHYREFVLLSETESTLR